MLDYRFVDDAHAARRNRAHREFLLSGHAELAHEKHVERRSERARYLERDGHAAARQREHKHVRAARVLRHARRQTPARVYPVTKKHRCLEAVSGQLSAFSFKSLACFATTLRSLRLNKSYLTAKHAGVV